MLRTVGSAVMFVVIATGCFFAHARLTERPPAAEASYLAGATTR